MKKKRQKAIRAELRKESITFDGWLKYEVTIQNEDGTLETVPAYGRDLQDALSRVVHDKKVEKIAPKIKKIHPGFWAFLWFSALASTTYTVLKHSEKLGDYTGLIYLGTVGILTAFSLIILKWFNLKNNSTPY